MDTNNNVIYKDINIKEIIRNYINKNDSVNIIGLIGGKSKSGYKWTTLKHNGVLFAPEYIKHNIPVIYEGQEVILDKLPEEYATAYARYIGTSYIENKTFRKNFWHDWKKLLGPNSVIKNLEGCDFSKIKEYLLKVKEKKNNVPKEEKDKLKELKEKEEAKYKIAYVDGKEEAVGNYRMEPPGIFLGRGSHPKIGSLKKRVLPEDITINIGKGEPIPEVPEGHKWQKVIHDRSLEWLASWIDNVTGKKKYVWLGTHSKFKINSDIRKFDLARKLKKKIKGIREQMNKDLVSDSIKQRQLATALYFIDNFALRVGNEKDTEKNADTIGTTSLRKEHIKFGDNNMITLDFLGKDSIRYYNSHQVNEAVYNNLLDFTKNKKTEDDIFDEISSSDVNEYLQQFMKDLTAKVFRTYNASNLFQKELNKISAKYNNSQDVQLDVSQYSSDSENNSISDNKQHIKEILEAFNKANLTVALLCNHQKNQSKGLDVQLSKIDDKIKEYIKNIIKLRNKKNKDNKSSNKNINDRINKLKIKIKELKQKKISKSELGCVSLSTSRLNYIDPRIVVAFAKKNNLDINKLYSPSEKIKFKWAIEDENVTADWKF